jgi:hypothetical protein
MTLWHVEHFWTLFVFTFGRDCYCIQQSRPKMKTKSVQKCSTCQSFTFPKWHSFKIGTLIIKWKSLMRKILKKHSIALSVFHTIIHNQHNQAQSCTIAQSHNQNTNFRTITQSKFKFCKFYHVMITIIHNHTQSICIVIFQALYRYLYNIS